MSEEIFSHMMLFKNCGSKQKCLVDCRLNIDQMQSSGLNPDQIKRAQSESTDFSRLNWALIWGEKLKTRNMKAQTDSWGEQLFPSAW